MNIQPALNLLVTRQRLADRTATMEEVTAACGIDVGASFSNAECNDLLTALRADTRVVVESDGKSGFTFRMISFPTEGYPNPKVNTVVYGFSGTSGFTARDWLDLAMAAMDQSDLVDQSDYRRVVEIVAEKITPRVHHGLRADYRGSYPVVVISAPFERDPEDGLGTMVSTNWHESPSKIIDGFEIVIPNGTADVDALVSAELLKRWGVALSDACPTASASTIEDEETPDGARVLYQPLQN